MNMEFEMIMKSIQKYLYIDRYKPDIVKSIRGVLFQSFDAGKSKESQIKIRLKQAQNQTQLGITTKLIYG